MTKEFTPDDEQAQSFFEAGVDEYYSGSPEPAPADANELWHQWITQHDAQVVEKAIDALASKAVDDE